MPTLLFFFFPFVFSWGLFAIIIIPYFLPTIIAMLRRSNSTGGIFLLNFFLGWTFIGWIGALIWSITSQNTTTTIIVNNTTGAPHSYGPPPGYGQQQPYGQQQAYNPPPSYTSDAGRPTHQTSPTIRRSSNPNDPQGTEPR